MKNLFLVAAENSAENYGAQVVDEFKRNLPGIYIFGVGGEKFIRRGVDVILHNREFAVIGLIEVLSSIVKLKKYMNLLYRKALANNVDAVLLIDYPDFNLRLAKKFKKAGIPVYYYISPTVWAWRYARVKLIKKYVDHLFVIFPFEEEIFKKEGIPFTYTGHPLIPLVKVTESREAFRNRMAVAAGESLISLLPGSRKSEVAFLLPRMLEAMEFLDKKLEVRLFLLNADSVDRQFLSGFLEKTDLKVEIVPQDKGYDLIHASDLVITTCGTSNLETAILGIPFVAVYRLNKLSYLLGKRFVKIDLYSIVNILAGEEVIPELIQGNFNTRNIITHSLNILDDRVLRNKMLSRFKEIKKSLTQDHNPPEIIYRKIMEDHQKKTGVKKNPGRANPG